MSQITSHILDTSLGRPAQGVPIELFQQVDGEWLSLGSGATNDDGRVSDLLHPENKLAAGVYKINFALSDYYNRLNINSFYPYAEVVFQIAGDGQHYHVPLLLNPYGYSTYRGS